MKDFGFALPIAAQLAKPDKKSKRVEEGIRYSKWMYYPTCAWCGLEDAGKEAGDARPHERHMLNCVARPLMQLPLVQTQVGYHDGKAVFQQLPRPGTFKGEVLQRQLRYPFRKLVRLPERHPITKIPTGKEIFFCEYYWKTNPDVVDYVWDGIKWNPWYEVIHKAKPSPVLAPPTVAQANWLSIFFRRKS